MWQGGQALGLEHAVDYLDACLCLSEHPSHPVVHQDIDLFHTVAIVKVPDEVSFGYGVADVDICFSPDLDHLNFRELPKGMVLGRLGRDIGLGLLVTDEGRADVTKRFLQLDGREIKLRIPVMPSMLTLDHKVVRQDCLCYLLERYDNHLQ